jgi:hypothetical protein
MVSLADRYRQVEPVISQRPAGDYFAVSAPGSALSIGVTADSVEEAREPFYTEREEWVRLSEAPAPRDFANPS